MRRGSWFRGFERPPWWAYAVVGVTAAVVAGAALVIKHPAPAYTPPPGALTATTPAAASAAPFQPPETATLVDDFTGRAGQVPTKAKTGQRWTRTGADPMVLTAAGMTVDGVGTGYTTTDLGTPPTEMGASVVFSPGTRGAVIALLVSKGPGLDLGNMGVHYIADATGWTLQVRVNGQMPFPVLKAGSYAQPLKTDGTVYNVDIRISGDTVTLTNADGSTATVTDPRISANLSGNLAWEVQRPDVAQAEPAFTKVWASTP